MKGREPESLEDQSIELSALICDHSGLLLYSTSTDRCETTIWNICSQYQECKQPSLDIYKCLLDLGFVNVRIFEPGLVCLQSLGRNEFLFIGKEAGRSW